MATLRPWRWRLLLPAIGSGLPLFTLWLVNLGDETGCRWPLPFVVVAGAFYGIVTFPGWFYALRGWRTMAVMCAWWATVGLVVGWAWDHEGVTVWRQRRAAR